MIVNLVASSVFGINAFPSSTPGAGLSDTKVPGKFSLEIWSTKKRFDSSSQENISRCIERMNFATRFISTRMSAQSPYCLNITSRGYTVVGAYWFGNASRSHIGPLLTWLNMSLKNTTRLTQTVLQKSLFFVVFIINPSHITTLISQIIMMTMALQFTLP